MAAIFTRLQEDVRIRVLEGDFDAPCEVCGVRPTAVMVEIDTPEFEAEQKAGEGAAAESEERYYCAEHSGAAEQLVASYRI